MSWFRKNILPLSLGPVVAGHSKTSASAADTHNPKRQTQNTRRHENHRLCNLTYIKKKK
jgi:hypothetical protein